MTGPNLDRPVVYGDIQRVVVLVEGLTRVMQHQPAEVLTDPAVNRSLRLPFDATQHRPDRDARARGDEPHAGQAAAGDGRAS